MLYLLPTLHPKTITYAELLDLRVRSMMRQRSRSPGLWRRTRPTNLYYSALDTTAYDAGTTVTWSDTTGTKAITLNNLASGSARVGAKSATWLQVPPNGGTNAVLPDFLMLSIVVQFKTTAPTAGGEIQVYLSFSSSPTQGTANAGFAASSGGTDAALGNVDQLTQMVFAGSLIASNALSFAANQLAYLSPVPPLDAYCSPVVYNTSGTGQALNNSNDVSVLSITPYFRQRAA